MNATVAGLDVMQMAALGSCGDAKLCEDDAADPVGMDVVASRLDWLVVVVDLLPCLDVGHEVEVGPFLGVDRVVDL